MAGYSQQAKILARIDVDFKKLSGIFLAASLS
jgi:hypothetical protein